MKTLVNIVYRLSGRLTIKTYGIMKQVFYVEKKCYLKTTFGFEIQEADGGEMPILYASEKKALERAKKIVNKLVDIYDCEVTIKSEVNPAVKDSCLFSERIENKARSVRYSISVYEWCVF